MKIRAIVCTYVCMSNYKKDFTFFARPRFLCNHRFVVNISVLKISALIYTY